MSEVLLYDIAQQLRLLARRHCHTAADGRLLSGGIDPAIETLRSRLLLVLDAIQDGLPAPGAHHTLAACQALIDANRDTIRDLRRLNDP